MLFCRGNHLLSMDYGEKGLWILWLYLLAAAVILACWLPRQQFQCLGCQEDQNNTGRKGAKRRNRSERIEAGEKGFNKNLEQSTSCAAEVYGRAGREKRRREKKENLGDSSKLRLVVQWCFSTG